VTNTGNVTLTNLTVTDPMLAGVTCPVTTLAPGETTTCSAPPYTVTAQDVTAGTIVNRATALANGGGGVDVSSDDVVEVSTAGAAEPGIHLVKHADADGPVAAGDAIVYTFTVTNTGNVTLRDITVDDPMLGTVTCARTTLAPGQSTTCTAPPYTVTAENVRAGHVLNHATASGSACDDTDGGCVLVSDDDSVVVDARASGELPDTGSPVQPATPLLGLGMLGVGAGLLVAGRRKRDES
jgi:uncharacterized repeat protein (TIGR01451 family)/LPXTG-motif cell wall-anchored protein